jgi:hypothetical protein
MGIAEKKDDWLGEIVTLFGIFFIVSADFYPNRKEFFSFIILISGQPHHRPTNSIPVI